MATPESGDISIVAPDGQPPTYEVEVLPTGEYSVGGIIFATPEQARTYSDYMFEKAAAGEGPNDVDSDE